MKKFFDIIDREHVQTVFLKFAGKSTNRISPCNFPHALKEMGIEIMPENDAQLFREADIDEDGGIDIDEFYRVIDQPSELEQWSSTLPLSKLLGFCLEAAIARTLAGSPDTPPDPIRRLPSLSPQDIESVAEEFAAADIDLDLHHFHRADTFQRMHLRTQTEGIQLGEAHRQFGVAGAAGITQTGQQAAGLLFAEILDQFTTERSHGPGMQQKHAFFAQPDDSLLRLETQFLRQSMQVGLRLQAGDRTKAFFEALG